MRVRPAEAVLIIGVLRGGGASATGNPNLQASPRVQPNQSCLLPSARGIGGLGGPSERDSAMAVSLSEMPRGSRDGTWE